MHFTIKALLRFTRRFVLPSLAAGFVLTIIGLGINKGMDNLEESKRITAAQHRAAKKALKHYPYTRKNDTMRFRAPVGLKVARAVCLVNGYDKPIGKKLNKAGKTISIACGYRGQAASETDRLGQLARRGWTGFNS